MNEVKTYVKESLQSNRVSRWNKKEVLVYIHEITNPKYKDQQSEYNKLIKQGLSSWNKVIGDKVKFIITGNSINADIEVFFPRVTTSYWGMCYYDKVTNAEFKKLTIKIGLSNEFHGAILSQNDKFVLVLHEFGHALGLGHSQKGSKNIMDAGYYPTKDWLTLEDIITLKIIYDLPVGAYYNEIEEKIKKLEDKYIHQKQPKATKQDSPDKNLKDSLNEIANLKLYKMDLNQNIKIPNNYQKLLKKEQLKNYNNE